MSFYVVPKEILWTQKNLNNLIEKFKLGKTTSLILIPIL